MYIITYVLAIKRIQVLMLGKTPVYSVDMVNNHGYFFEGRQEIIEVRLVGFRTPFI